MPCMQSTFRSYCRVPLAVWQRRGESDSRSGWNLPLYPQQYMAERHCDSLCTAHYPATGAWCALEKVLREGKFSGRSIAEEVAIEIALRQRVMRAAYPARPSGTAVSAEV